MSKRSREYFESFQEFNRLCDKEGVCSPPKQKRKTSVNTNNESTPPSQINPTILSKSLSPSPSPPSILNINNINITDEQANGEKKVFDEYIFYFANIGVKNKRTGVRKVWTDLNKKRIELFNTIIPNNGGKIIQNINEFDTNKNKNALLIMVAEKIKRKDFDELFDKSTQENKNFIFVTSEYITASLKYKNKKISPKQFPPKCLTQKKEKIASKNSEKHEMDVDEEQKSEKSDKKQEKQPKQSWLDSNKHKFACQVENDGSKVNHNANITQIFDEMGSMYSCLGDKWRVFSYKKVNDFIKQYPYQIKTEKDIQKLIKMKGFSQKLGRKVLEIISTGKLRKLNELKSMPQIATIQLFSNIFGVGSITANKWFNLGLRTLNDVGNAEKWNIKLQDRQKMGLKYYDDLLVKIPRTEVVAIEKFLKLEINKMCPGCKVMICGSYRRGKLKSGDVDVLVTHKHSDQTRGLLNKIVTKLHAIGFLVDDLSTPSGHNKHAEDHDSYMGVAKLMDDEYTIYRHIDIKVYKPEHFAFAVLYFTGSDHFNRSMRYFAKKKGYTLSDTMLAPAIRHNNSKIVTFTQRAIKCQTENEIFEALGLKYVKPTERNTYESFGQSFGGNANEDCEPCDDTPNNYSNTP